MEKKLTKTEIKEMEAKQQELRNLRYEVIKSIKNFREDVQATIRFYKINNETDKLNYEDTLKVEEELKLLRRYNCLDFLKPIRSYEKGDKENRVWSFVSIMLDTFNEYECYKDRVLDTVLEKDALWNSEIIWDAVQMKLYMKLAKMFGYTKFYYTNSSSGALANISNLVKLGAKVIGVCGEKRYNKEGEGLIFDITEVNIEEE